MQKWLHRMFSWRIPSIQRMMDVEMPLCRTPSDLVRVLQRIEGSRTMQISDWEYVFTRGASIKHFCILDAVDQYYAQRYPGQAHAFERIHACKNSVLGFVASPHFSNTLLHYWESSYRPTHGPWWGALFLYIPMDRWKSLDIYDKTLRRTKKRTTTPYNSLWFKMYSGLIRARYGNYCAESSRQWQLWTQYWKTDSHIQTWVVDFPRDAASFSQHRIQTFFHACAFGGQRDTSCLELMASASQVPFSVSLATLLFGRSLPFTQTDAHARHPLQVDHVSSSWSLAANLYGHWCDGTRPLDRYQGLIAHAEILRPDRVEPYQYGRMYQILQQFEQGSESRFDFLNTKPPEIDD